MITLKQFCKVCTRLGFKVFKDEPYEDFYYCFYENNKDKAGNSMARLVDFGIGNDTEVTVFKPEWYSFLAPSTCSIDKTYSDIKEFEKDLMENYFTLRKYWFKYNMREHSVI